MGGLPALVPPPSVAEVPPAGDATGDAEVALAGEPAVRELLANVAATELSGLVEFVELVDLRVGRGSERRDATATVRWRDPVSGARLLQRYALELTRRADGWHAALDV